VVLGFAGVSAKQRGWVGLTLTTGALLLVLGAVKLREENELWIQVAIGVIALPAWLVVSGQVLRRTESTEGVR